MSVFAKSDKVEIRIGKSDFGKEPSIDVREYVAYGGDNEPKPTKKGFLVPVESWDEFVAAVNAFNVNAKKSPKKPAREGTQTFADLDGVYFFANKDLDADDLASMKTVGAAARAAHKRGDLKTVKPKTKLTVVKVQIVAGKVKRAKLED